MVKSMIRLEQKDIVVYRGKTETAKFEADAIPIYKLRAVLQDHINKCALGYSFCPICKFVEVRFGVLFDK